VFQDLSKHTPEGKEGTSKGDKVSDKGREFRLESEKEGEKS